MSSKFLIKTFNLRRIIFIGLLIRAFLAPISSGLNDGYYWYILFIDVLIGKNPYVHRHLFYPPSWFYTLTPFAYIYAWLTSILRLKPIPIQGLTFPLYKLMLIRWGPPAILDPLSATLMKIPLILSDLGVSLAIFNLVKEITSDDGKACLAASLWFLNPYLITISTLWGQIDSLVTFFFIMSYYFAYKKHFFLSGFCASVAISYKVIATILIIPLTVFIIFSCSESRWRGFTTFITALILTFLSISAPFIILSLNEYILSVLWPLSYGGSYGAKSFLYYFLRLASVSDNVARVSLVSLFIIVTVIIVYLIYKSERNAYRLFSRGVLYFLFSFYAFQVGGNERYFLFGLPFLIIETVCFAMNRKVFHLYWLMPFLYIMLSHGVLLFFMPLFAIINNEVVGETILTFYKTYDGLILYPALLHPFLLIIQSIPSLLCLLFVVRLLINHLGDIRCKD